MYFAAYAAGGIVSNWDVICSLNVFLKLCLTVIMPPSTSHSRLIEKNTTWESGACEDRSQGGERFTCSVWSWTSQLTRVVFPVRRLFLAPILVKRLLCMCFMYYGYRPLLLTLVVLLLNNVFNHLFYICAEKAVSSWGKVSRENIQ